VRRPIGHLDRQRRETTARYLAGGHASISLFHCCRRSAACAPVRCVGPFPRNRNDQPRRRGKAGHSNRLGQGRSTAGGNRYPFPSRGHSCFGPGHCASTGASRASTGASRGSPAWFVSPDTCSVGPDACSRNQDRAQDEGCKAAGPRENGCQPTTGIPAVPLRLVAALAIRRLTRRPGRFKAWSTLAFPGREREGEASCKWSCPFPARRPE